LTGLAPGNGIGSMKALAATTAVIIALAALPQRAGAQIGGAQYCLQSAGGTRCVFATMGECERARTNSPSGQCTTRTDAYGTTGLGDPPGRSSGVPTEPPASR
jgi:hypothetical protein